MKKLALVCCIALSITALAACGKSNKKEDATTTEKATTVEQATTEEATEAPTEEATTADFDAAAYDAYLATDPEAVTFAGAGKLENEMGGWLGNGAENTMTYTITVADAGDYEVIFRYACGEDRSFTVTSNDKTYEVAGPNSGGWTTATLVDTEAITVTLGAGENEITISNATAYAPNIYRMIVSKTAK